MNKDVDANFWQYVLSKSTVKVMAELYFHVVLVKTFSGSQPVSIASTSFHVQFVVRALSVPKSCLLRYDKQGSGM